MFGDDDIEDQQPEAVGVAEGEGEDPDAEITLSDSWVVINSYFAANNLVSQQLESFNHFCKIKLQVRWRPVCPAQVLQPAPSAGMLYSSPETLLQHLGLAAKYATQVYDTLAIRSRVVGV
jgi:hypothetical protein